MDHLYRSGLLARDVAPREVSWAAGVPPPLHDNWLRRFATALVLIFPILTVLVVSLRIYGRVTMKQFGIDDALIIVATCLAIAFCGSINMYIYTAYVGIHAWDIPPDADPQPSFVWGFLDECLYNPVLALVKSSVLIFLLRLAGTRNGIRYTIHALNTFNLLMMVATFLVVVFQCRPISGAWDLKEMSDAKCINAFTFSVSTAIITIITDLLVLAIPVWIITGLKMPRKVKLPLIGVFFLGIIVTVVSCIRLWLLIKVLDPHPKHPDPDPSYTLGPCAESIEGNLAIITASIPALWPLIRQWFPRLVSRLGSTNKTPGPDSYPPSGFEGSNRRHTFKMKSMRGQGRSEIRSTSPSGSEEEIMTYNGILRTTAVTVKSDASNGSDYEQENRDKKETTTVVHGFP